MVSTPSASRIASTFQVRVLGPFALERDGTAIDVGDWQPRVVTLFKLLVTSPGCRRSRDEISDLLWPDATPAAGAGNVRMVIHRLRHALGGDPWPVVSEHGWVALNPAYTWELDLARFMSLTTGPESDVTTLEEAATLYRGEPLAEDRYEDWAVPIREGAERSWGALCLRLAQLYRARGSQEDAALWLERLLESDPLHEQALQDLLVVLADLGRRTEALRRYRQFEQLLSEEMDVPPEPETLALVARLEGYLKQASVPSAPGRKLEQIVPMIPSYPLTSGGPLVGRDTELAAILAALPPRDTHAPHLVLIAGEAGNGKTHILAEVARRAHEAAILTLAGGCYEQESRLPYGPVHDALADYIHLEPEPVLRAQLESLLPALAQIVPEVRTRLGSVGEMEESGTGDQRLALFTTVCESLERISQDMPLVLLLDDLHWADEATLQLLHFLLRQPGLDRVLIVGTYREEEAFENESLLQLTTELKSSPWAHLISLPPLDEQDLGAVLIERIGGRCARSLVKRLYERSGGNPFFAVQMLSLLNQEKQLEQGEDGWRLAADAAIVLPQEVREAVARRVGRLGPDEQEALRLASVLGRDFSFPALEGMWAGDERSLFAALDAAELSQLLRQTEAGYVFRHPLMREIVYSRIPMQRSTRLHARAGAVLESLYGDRRSEHAAELAWHGLYGEKREQALHYSLLAGDQAASLYAYSEAEQHYRRALESVEALSGCSDDSPRLKGQLLEKLGALLKTVGRYGEAIDALDSAAAQYAALEDLEGQRRAVSHIGRVHLAMGTLDKGMARLKAASDRLDDESPSQGLAALHLSLAFLQFRHGMYAEQLASSERAAQLAGAIGDRRLAAEAELVRAYALPFLGRSSEFGATMQNVVRLAEEIGDSPTHSRALCSLGAHLAERGELDNASRQLSRALELTERLGDPSRVAFVASTCGLVAFWRGEWEEAHALFNRSLEIYRGLDALPDALSSLFGIGALAMVRGEWETGERYLKEHMCNAQSAGDLRWLDMVYVLLAERDLLAGRPEKALHRIQQLRDLPGLTEDALLEVLPTLAWAQMEMGDVVGAEESATAAVEQARRGDTQRVLAEALRIRGSVLAAQARWEEAEQRFQEALSLAENMPCAYAVGRSLYAYGSMLVRQGKREVRGRELLDEALSVFQRLGARPYIERTQRELMKMQTR